MTDDTRQSVKRWRAESGEMNRSGAALLAMTNYGHRPRLPTAWSASELSPGQAKD